MVEFDPAALRSFVRGQQLAHRESRLTSIPGSPLSPAEAFERAMELWDINLSAFDRPRTRTEREGIDSVRDAWGRLRSAGWGQ